MENSKISFTIRHDFAKLVARKNEFGVMEKPESIWEYRMIDEFISGTFQLFFSRHPKKWGSVASGQHSSSCFVVENSFRTDFCAAQTEIMSLFDFVESNKEKEAMSS